MRFKLCLAALAASVAVGSPAYAQSVSASAQAEARGVVLQPLTLSRVQDLDFGTVVASATAGTVTINANTGARSTLGGVTGVPNYPGDRARFQGAGTEGQEVTLTLNAPSLLINQSDPMATVGASLVLDSGGTSRIIGAGGMFQVGVGGTFSIAANQLSGLYLANFDLTAEYE